MAVAAVALTTMALPGAATAAKKHATIPCREALSAPAGLASLNGIYTNRDSCDFHLANGWGAQYDHGKLIGLLNPAQMKAASARNIGPDLASLNGIYTNKDGSEFHIANGWGVQYDHGKLVGLLDPAQMTARYGG
jgi:hypothetical protein